MTGRHGDEVDRRDVLKTIGAGALGTASVAATSGSVSADESATHYHNPVWEPHFPDPTVIRADDGTYYAYGTNMDRNSEDQERLVPILRSQDLVNWTYVGEAFDSYPDWRGDIDGSLWAPNVVYYDGEYRIYYSYSFWGDDGDEGIGVATSSTPEGPFTDQGPLFRHSDLSMTNCIDADFNVVDGTPYMVWGSWGGIYGVELTSDGMDYVGGTTFQLVGGAREAPFIIRENGYYYLFYSTGNCCEGLDTLYEVEVGRSDSFFGPYYNQAGTDLRDLNESHSGIAILTNNDRHPGPGHNTAIQDDAGDWWMLYHAYDARDGGYVDGTWRRVLMVDRIQWENDWPVVACNGTPSYQSPMPHAGSYDCANVTGGTGPIAGGTYRIENVNSGKVLDVSGGGTADGDNVIQWSWHGGDNQRWNVHHNTDGTYRIENVNSGKVLDVDGGSTSDGANVLQWSWHGGDNQRWNIIENSDGTYRLENVNSGKVADVYQAGTADGDNVIQWGWWGGANQKWTFEQV